MSSVSANGLISLGVRTLMTAGPVAVVAALALGILGMHGLSQHGAATHPTQRVAAVRVDPHAHHPAPDHTPIAADTTADTTPDAAGSSGVPLVGSTTDENGSASGMLMMCAAMLLAAAVSVLLTLRLMRSAHRAPLSFMPMVRVLAFPVTARFGTGPPAVWEFSVVRC